MATTLTRERVREPLAHERSAEGVLELRQRPAELAERLVDRLERGDVLDAYLFAAGLRQTCEDRLEPELLRLGDVEELLFSRRHSRLSGAVAAVAGRADRVRRAARVRRVRELASWDARLAALLDRLADGVMGGGIDPLALRTLTGQARALRRDLPHQTAFRREVMRLPSCFRSFDQHPDDVDRLVGLFAGPRPDLEREIVVIGLRTSGSYLAPLTAAALRARGYPHARSLTIRPGAPLAPCKRRMLRRLARRGGTVLITDDPPSSGGSITRVAARCERLGFAAGSVVLMFATMDLQLPDALRRHPLVVLPPEGWSIERRLAPDRVREALGRLWQDRSVGPVTRLPLHESSSRSHRAERYRVEFTEHGDGTPRSEEVLVRGAGLGYLGDHASAVERLMRPWLAETYGISDGLVYRRWIPESARTGTPPRGQDAAQVAEYAAARRDRLALDADVAPALGGQSPVWEVASEIMSGAFARAWRPMRVLALDSLMRDALRTDCPSVIDGDMAPANWFRGDDGSLVKIKGDERAHSNRNLACSDAAFDAASAAAWDGVDADVVRREFARASGEWIDEERWLAYRLVAHWAARRDGLIDRHAARRAGARALQEYFAHIYLDGLPRGEGPLCALDVDGVLETETLGFPGLSPAGAVALRALIAHGHRPVLSTGRSIGEVAERCRTYGLAGGVAEYGAALYLSARDEARDLRSPAAAAAVERVRARLAAIPAVELGTDHRHTVRAWTRDSRGARRGLPADAIEAALAAAPEAIRAVQGEAQTDFVPAGVDKATGLRSLTAAIDPAAPTALAVGDTAEDLPMLRLAELGLAVGNRSGALRHAGVRSVRRHYQAGLSQAVGELIGHRPGACPDCAVEAPDRRRRAMLEVLAAREGGRTGLAAHAARLVWMGVRDGGR